MSLATFLLGAKPSGKKKVIDTELDALFQSKVCCVQHPRLKIMFLITSSQTSEDHPESSPNGHRTAEKKKKRKPDVHVDEPDSKRSKPSPADAASSSLPPAGKQKKSGKNRVKSAPEPVSEPGTSKPESSKILPSNESGSESSDEDGDHPSTLIHESLQKDKPSKPASRKAKRAPSDETKERRDARTVFIGNLAPDVAVKRVSETRFC